jgi:hypothetical protein
MEKHYVTFLSPGTFLAEKTTKEIDSWDIEKAKILYMSITERYEATPYGFYFTTRERKKTDFDSREIKRSGIHFINCQVLTLEEIEENNDPEDKILIANMKANGYGEAAISTKGWKWAQPLKKGDMILY